MPVRLITWRRPKTTVPPKAKIEMSTAIPAATNEWCVRFVDRNLWFCLQSDVSNKSGRLQSDPLFLVAASVRLALDCRSRPILTLGLNETTTPIWHSSKRIPGAFSASWRSLSIPSETRSQVGPGVDDFWVRAHAAHDHYYTMAVELAKEVGEGTSGRHTGGVGQSWSGQ